MNQLASPVFVLEEEKLLKNLEILAAVEAAAGVDIILALKAFAMWPMFGLIKQYLSGATASSLDEARLIAEEMQCQAHTYAPAYMPQEFDELLKYSSHITFNSLQQYERYLAQAQASEQPVSLGLRVNPECSTVKVDLYNPAAPTSRLGETLSNLPEQLPSGIEGLHFHTLCESSSYDLEKVLAAFEVSFASYLPHLKWVNFGGGHHITRADYDTDHFIQLIKGFKTRYPHLRIILEPGSAVVLNAGYLQTSVLDIIENGGVKTAILDVSFTAHMPDTLEMPYRPQILEGYEDASKGECRYRLGGVSCLAGDYLENYSFDRALHVGDIITFEDMMQYSMVKTTTFNGVKHPAIAVKDTAGAFKLLRVFTYHDFRAKLG